MHCFQWYKFRPVILTWIYFSYHELEKNTLKRSITINIPNTYIHLDIKIFTFDREWYFIEQYSQTKILCPLIFLMEWNFEIWSKKWTHECVDKKNWKEIFDKKHLGSKHNSSIFWDFQPIFAWELQIYQLKICL